MSRVDKCSDITKFSIDGHRVHTTMLPVKVCLVYEAK